MSTYPLTELLQQWSRADLTAEQAIGHLMQHLQKLTERLTELEKRVRLLESPPKVKS